ncbi:MAG TPA: SRPBCC family protein [Chitinophagaceae bacterium]|jgi:ligand-binding SRPBCC domain-containing protein|nr:SRPBCC family protein [Chitinophagaceae bacterium]
MSKVYTIKAVQKIPIDIDTAWAFFSNPGNLQEITPPDVDFRVTSKYLDSTMYPGQVIEYKLKPLWGISFYWMTEITHVNDRKFFIDEQRFGPYTLWHHQHHFAVIEGGVEMTDFVHYKVPAWFIGDILNAVVIKKQLGKIFSFRFTAVEKKFGRWPGQEEDIVIE